MAKTKATKKKIQEPIYSLKINTNQDTYEAKGDNLNELVSGFTPPTLFKTKTIVAVTRDKRTVQRDLKVFECRMIFGNKTRMELFINNIVRQLT